MLIPRVVWGAKPLTAYSKKIRNNYRTGIVVHHSVTPEGGSAAEVRKILQGIDADHRARGWGGIGYNLAVDYAGRIYVARGIDVLGCHAENANGRNFGVAYIGDGRKNVTPAAVDALRKVVALLEKKAGHPLTVLGHQNLKATSCPGPLIQRLVQDGTFKR